MRPEKLTLLELQRLATSNDKYLLELGRRALKFNFCLSDPSTYRYCEHEIELDELKQFLENEIPPECPHCGEML